MIKLTSKHLQQMLNHAQKIYPEECCGLLLGKIEQNKNSVTEVIETENSWEARREFEFLSGTEGTKRNHFTIAPKVILKIQKEARDRNLVIVGVYHSHPDHPAIPSEFDRLIAWSHYSYIIVSVQEGKAVDIKSWKLDDKHQFQSEEMVII